MSFRHAHVPVFFILAALIGVLSYTSASSYLALQYALKKADEARHLYTTSGIMRYGTVVSVDVPGRLLVVAMQRYPGDALRADIRVPEDALITKQQLIGQSSIATGATAPTPSSMSEISAGMRVALFIRIEKGVFEAPVVVFGNPL